MIITAFTIAKDYEEAVRLKIKKYKGKECPHCSSHIWYTSNKNCTKCQDGRNKKHGHGKSVKIKSEFYCKQCRGFLSIERLGKVVKTSKGSWSLCITHNAENDARCEARQKP